MQLGETFKRHGQLHYKIFRNTGKGSTTDSSAAVGKPSCVKSQHTRLGGTTVGKIKLCVYVSEGNVSYGGYCARVIK